MKKLLVLMLVLGVATLASAGLQISVGGVKEPVDTEIILNLSDTIELDIWTDTDVMPFQSENWALVVSGDYGTICGGVAAYTAAGVTNNVGPCADNADVMPDPPQDGVWGALANISPTYTPIPADTTLIDSIIFHCEGPGDAVIQLYSIVSGEPFGDISGGTLLDTVIIHQTPEPITMALLGFGGLFLRRRK